MKKITKTVVERIGENMGPVPKDYDIWDKRWGGLYPNNPEIRVAKFQMFLDMQEAFLNGNKIRVSYDPDFGDFLADVGLYDGWPYWEPVPCFKQATWLGGEWHTWYQIHSWKIVEEK